MKSLWIVHFFIVPIIFGCAGFTQQSRLEKFSEIADAYEQALLMADYDQAAKYINPLKLNSPPDLNQYKNIKIVEYKITDMDVSADHLEIKQNVEIQYFMLNSNRLRTARHSQIWHFQEKENIWLLETGLPTL